jgi:hypothetical protein
VNLFTAWGLRKAQRARRSAWYRSKAASTEEPTQNPPKKAWIEKGIDKP